MNYTHDMYVVEQSDTFKAWLNDLRDAIGRLRITARLTIAGEGNLGDCAPVGDGVHEMRSQIAIPEPRRLIGLLAWRSRRLTAM